MSQKISEMTDASALTGTELVPVVQGGANRKTTAAAIAALGGGGGGGDGFAKAFGYVDATSGLRTDLANNGIAMVEWNCGEPGVYRIVFEEGFFEDIPVVVATLVEPDFIGHLKVIREEDATAVQVITTQLILQDDGGGVYSLVTGALNQSFSIFAIGAPGPGPEEEE